MKLYCAGWVLPISSPPIRNGAVAINESRKIFDLGPSENLTSKYPAAETFSSPQSVIMPGLVNAHTHLELSMMKDAVPKGLDFSDWAFRTITKRPQFPEANVLFDCEKAVRTLVDSGTVAVGDIANHSATSLPYLKKSGLYAVVFNEVTGFSASIAEQRFSEFSTKIPARSDNHIRHTLAPHAPYSVSPKLFALVAGFLKTTVSRTSIHVAESTDESEFLRTGAGRMKSMIERIGRWDDNWKAPNQSPVQYVKSMGILGPTTIVVHAVHVGDGDIDVLRSSGASVCTCPRSNQYINVGGTAPVGKMLEAGINVCLGTDSLASCDDLLLWNEMKAVHDVHAGLSAESVVKMATLNGARALGFDKQIGSIEPGKDGALISVEPRQPVDEPYAALIRGFDSLEKISAL